MKNIFVLLFCTLFAVAAAAQDAPTLPPMRDLGAWQNPTPQAPTMLRMRGMNIDDGYGILTPYGAARLFGGTPAHDFYMDAMRYRGVSLYTLWSGVGLSAMGLLTLATEIGRGPSDDMERKYHSSVVGVGVTMLVLGAPLAAVGVTFRVKAKRSLARAVDAYTRSSLHDPRTPEISIGFTGCGVGLSCRF